MINSDPVIDPSSSLFIICSYDLCTTAWNSMGMYVYLDVSCCPGYHPSRLKAFCTTIYQLLVMPLFSQGASPIGLQVTTYLHK